MEYGIHGGELIKERFSFLSKPHQIFGKFLCGVVCFDIVFFALFLCFFQFLTYFFTFLGVFLEFFCNSFLMKEYPKSFEHMVQFFCIERMMCFGNTA